MVLPPYILRILQGKNMEPDGNNDNIVGLLFNILDSMDEHPELYIMMPLR